MKQKIKKSKLFDVVVAIKNEAFLPTSFAFRVFYLYKEIKLIKG